MADKKLSILIATLPLRAHFLARIIDNLGALPEGVEILVDNRDKQVPTGTKRNDLISRSKAEYVVFVDDDDYVTPDYVSSIVEALNANPDCVTFCGWYTENGRNHLDWTIKLGEKYEARTEDGKYQIFRWPNHLAVIRRSIALQIKFPDIWHGEDYKWSEQLMKSRLLQTEVHIPKKLYHYQYITGK